MATGTPKPELLVIVGETASGKSDLALKIAKKYGGEIISADSWTVYKGFDIGTSKPTITQQKAVKHHLIDVREPTEGFNAPMFKQMAEEPIADIQKRSKLPILVGGTGLYIDSLLYDFSFLPDAPAEERARLNTQTIDALLQLAGDLGIDLSGIDTRNKRRIIRAIEAKGLKPTKSDMKQNSLIIGLKIDTQALKKLVEQRINQMIKAGLETEVESLVNRYGWNIEPMKGIGYYEWREYFEGRQTLPQTKQKIVSATMNLAKRQRTWFKRNKNIHWFDSAAEAYNYIASILST